jgi:hypothetical protein
MVCRQPKWDIQPVSTALAMVSAVMSRMGTTSGQRMKWSNAMRQYVYPADFGRGPMRWLRQQSKDFYAGGFDALVKRWDNCINVGEGHVKK